MKVMNEIREVLEILKGIWSLDDSESWPGNAWRIAFDTLSLVLMASLFLPGVIIGMRSEPPSLVFGMFVWLSVAAYMAGMISLIGLFMVLVGICLSVALGTLGVFLLDRHEDRMAREYAKHIENSYD